MGVTNALSVVLLMSLAAGGSYVLGDITVNETCKLTVTNESRAEFTETILRRQYNFMYMKLQFNRSIKAKDNVIGPNHWIWTYKGKDGGHEYLFLPQDFGYLSFGLLWSRCNSSEYTISIEHFGNCSGLTVGEKQSDQLIGEAMGDMTTDIAARRDNYNSSYWCYYKRLFIEPSSLYYTCSNTVCTLQSIEFRCCKYVIDFVTRKRSIQCSKEHYHFNELWWALPIITGNICFALYPLYLSTIGEKLHSCSKRSKSRNVEDGSNSSDDGTKAVKYIRLSQENPVTLLETVFSPFLKIFNCHGPLFTRLWRTLIIVVPMMLPAIRIYLDAKFSLDLIREALSKGVTIGFSSLVGGYERSGQFLLLLGGPYVAISMYFVFGIMFITFPQDFETHLVKGLFEPKANPHFILTIPLKHREKLGRILVKRHSGYKRFHHYLLLQLYMILNWRFWRHALRIFVHRWSVILNCTVQKMIRSKVVVAIIGAVVFPVYFVFCIIETILSFVYFAVPVVSCMFITLNAYCISINSHFTNSSLPVYIFGKIVILGMSIAFFITWYMYCLIFFDGFFFLSRIVMFTYTGLIQFPQLSYGYIILVLMACYYLTDSLNQFASGYRDLLKLSIEVCEKVQNKNFDDFPTKLVRKNSIPRKLFNIIVENHEPKRVQVCKTVLKVATIVSVLCISIELLITFDKISELSLVIHVFSVLFICALPKILREMCIRRLKHKSKKKLRLKIYQTVLDYCNRHGNVGDSSDFDGFSTYSAAGYERFDIESD